MSAAKPRSGLVHSSTSHTGLIALDPVHTRFRRMKHGTITAARLMQEQLQEGSHRYRVAMITLTYRPDEWYSARHISALITTIREFLRRRHYPLRYVWVMELTKRGIPHYHLLVWLPRGLTLPKPDKRGWWKHGLTKIEWARNAVGYIAKYASKGEDHAHKFPRGARIHGTGGLDPRRATERRWWLSPGWIREQFSASDDYRRVAGGGFASRVTGEWLPSPYLVLKVNGVLCCVLKSEWESGKC